jgi:hypothetical protein
MNAFARSLMVAAIASHIGLTMSGALARPGGSAAGAAGGGGHGSNGTSAGGVGSANGHGVNGVGGVAGTNGATSGYGGHNAVGENGGHDGTTGHHGYGDPGSVGKGDPAPSPASPFGGGPPIYNPPAVFNYQSGFTGLAGPSGACGTAPQLPDTSWYTDRIDGIEVISQQTQNYLQSCGCDTQACVADALDNYANALEQAVAPAPPAPGQPSAPTRKLPRAVRELPRIVHEAAARVRAAPTKVAAQKAVQAAIEVVQKTAAKAIALMRPDDPDATNAVTRGASLVADTLKSAQSGLMRAETL